MRVRAIRGRRLASNWLVAATLAAFVPAFIGGSPSAAFAADSPASAALTKGKSAWDEADMEGAEAGFKDAIEKGGLARKDLLDAYVYLASAQAVLGNKNEATKNFRIAAALDANFVVPSEGGKKPAALADAARKLRKTGLSLHISAPKTSSAGAPFSITIQNVENELSLMTGATLVAKDGLSGKIHEEKVDLSKGGKIEIPSKLTLPGATITLHATGVDAHGSELASTEERVTIDAAGATEPVAASSANETKTADRTPDRHDEKKKKGGFFSSPWTYVIGGVLLAGAGAGVYFYTRPPETVTLGTIKVQGQ